MRTTRKILLGLTVILTLAFVLALAISATEYELPVRDVWKEAGGPMGVIHGDTANGWENSGYTDIDDHVNFKNGEKDVWVQIATKGTTDLKSDKYPNLTYGNGYRAYFNEYEKKVVIVATGSELHSQLYAYATQADVASSAAIAKRYALWDKLYNLHALEYIFTQEAFKDTAVPGLGMTWSEYMSSQVKASNIYSVTFPAGATNANIDTFKSGNGSALIIMERDIADALYTAYSTNETYAAAFAEHGNPSTLTGSTYNPTDTATGDGKPYGTPQKQKSRALLTGLSLWAQENGIGADTIATLSTAAQAYAEEKTLTYYFAKGSGASFGWSGGLENYFGDGGYMSMPFLINSNTSENANVGGLSAYVKTLEVRNTKGSTSVSALRNFGSVLIAFDHVDTVLLDKTVSSIYAESSTSEDRALFRSMESVKTIAHVSFGSNGKFTDTVEYGVADFSGFTATNNNKDKDKNGNLTCIYVGNLGINSPSITTAVWFKTLTLGGVDYSGVIQNYTLYSATGLKQFTIPANDAAPLTEIRANAFANSGLKSIYVLRPVADNFKVASSAFQNCKSVTMYVLDKASAANAQSALVASSIKNVKVELFNPVSNPVTWDGTLVKMTDFETAAADNLAMRIQFTWNEKGEAAEANKAYTFKSLGIIASTAATYDLYLGQVEEETGLTIPSLVAQEMLEASKGENSKVIQVLVTNADFTDGRRTFLKGYDKASGYYPFCLSLYGMTEDQITTEFYVAAYTEWYDEETGNTYYTFTTQDWVRDEVAKNSMSLYDATLGLVKKGLINYSKYDSDADANKYFYSVLAKGALTTDEFTSHSVSANLDYDQFLNDDGSFTYWNVDYRKYVENPDFTGEGLAVKLGAGTYDYRPDTTESEASSGVQWSILKDGAKYVVLLTKNRNAAPEGVEYDYTIPSSGRNTQYGYYQPFHYLYGNVNHNTKSGATAAQKTRAQNGAMKVYSPAVTASVYNAITTVVIDHGIVALATDSLAAIPSANTFVLPESCVTIKGCAIDKNTSLADIIWTGDPDAKSKDKYNVDHLYDLRGCTAAVSSASFLCDNAAAENVVTAINMNVDGQLAFNNATNLERYWSTKIYSEYTKPDSGVIDMSKSWHKEINKGFFNAGSKINTIMIQGTLKVTHNTFKTNEDTRSFRPLGRGKSYNFVLTDSNGTKIDYVWNGADGTGNTPFLTYLYNLIVDLHVGVIAAETANCDNLSVNGVSVKTIFPDLFS